MGDIPLNNANSLILLLVIVVVVVVVEVVCIMAVDVEPTALRALGNNLDVK